MRKQRRRYRRARIRHAVLTRAPIRLSGGRLNRIRPGRDFNVHHRRIHIPDLPSELVGLKIVHVSDPHIGELVTPGHLEHIIDAVGEIGADMIAMTGDFVDVSNDYLPAIIEAMQRLDAPLGCWFVLGNHDYLDNADIVKQAFNDAGLGLLLNEAVNLRYRDQTIAVGGIDWDHRPAEMGKMVRKTSLEMKQSDLSILLAHHPHAFDTARRCGVNLTLSGHTHGGQMLLSKTRGKKGSIGLANFTFRYPRGLYERGRSRLYVSAGVGSWFPWRFRCPAEIACLELLQVD